MTSETSLMSPCFFGISLQQGSQLVAGINIAIYSLVAVVITIYLMMFQTALSEINAITGESASFAGAVFVVWIIFMIVFLIEIGANVLLLKAANEKSPKKIKIYLIVTIVMMVLGLLGSLTHTFTFGTLLITILTYLPPFYELWVVVCFYKQITNPNHMQSEYIQP